MNLNVFRTKYCIEFTRIAQFLILVYGIAKTYLFAEKSYFNSTIANLVEPLGVISADSKVDT
jgi:hypothetical protein